MLNIFTIVLNGMPRLRDVHRSIEQIDGDWRWTIVHGVADPVADTSWCKSIPAPEDDGTLPSIMCWSRPVDSRIKVIHQDRWPGKTAMVNAALKTFDKTGTLLQMDADEVWNPAQLRIMPSLFERFKEADGALFLCRYWVGPRRYICTPGTFGNHSAYEWARAWRFEPGMLFERHEPPILAGAMHYANQRCTASLGLVFDHYAYADRSQIVFKQSYYGPEYDPEAWDRLQAMRGPVDLLGVLPWVKESVISYEA